MSEDLQSSFNHDGDILSEVGRVFSALPSRFRPNIVEEAISFHFCIDGEDWTVIIERSWCSVSQGKVIEEVDCSLHTSSEILLGTIRGTYTPALTDLISGKIRTNNPMLLMTFKDVFA